MGYLLYLMYRCDRRCDGCDGKFGNLVGTKHTRGRGCLDSTASAELGPLRRSCIRPLFLTARSATAIDQQHHSKQATAVCWRASHTNGSNQSMQLFSLVFSVSTVDCCLLVVLEGVSWIHATTISWNYISCWNPCHWVAWFWTWNLISRSCGGMNQIFPTR